MHATRSLLIAVCLFPFLAWIGCGEDDPSGPTGDSGSIPQYAADFERLFDPTVVKTIRISIPVTEWNAVLKNYDKLQNTELFRAATVVYEDGEATKTLANTGFRLRGNTTRYRPEAGSPGAVHDPANALYRIHFKLKFNEQFDGDETVYGAPAIATVAANKGRELIPGIRSLNFKYNVRDASYCREVFSYDLFHRFGVQGPRVSFARVYLKIGDGAEQYYGVYEMIESVDKEWIRRRYGKSSWLFKCLYQGEGPADLTTTDTDGSSSSGKIGIEKIDAENPAEGASWSQEWPNDSRYRPAYDLKAKETEFVAGQDKLNALMTLLAKPGLTTAELEAAFDVQAFLKFYAVNAYVGNWDDYSRLGNNYYLLLRPTDNKWMLIPYDYDNTFQAGPWTIGSDGPADAPFVDWHAAHNGSLSPILSQKILSFSVYVDTLKGYIAALHDAADGLFTWTAVRTRLQAFQAAIAPHVTGYQAVSVPGSKGGPAYSADLSQIEAYVTARLARARAEAPSGSGTTGTTGSSGSSGSTGSGSGGKVYATMHLVGPIVGGWMQFEAMSNSDVHDWSWSGTISAGEFKFCEGENWTGDDFGDPENDGTAIIIQDNNMSTTKSGAVTILFNDLTGLYSISP